MTAIDSIKHAVEKLSERERRELLQWLEEREEAAWDEQISADFDAGKLAGLVERAREAAGRGELRDLP